MKKNTQYCCSGCGYNTQKWMGKCPSCNEWNTFYEDIIEAPKKHQNLEFSQDKPITLDQINCEEETRMTTGIAELDRVLGGGIVQGSLTLVGGDPGIGKSTLLLQVVGNTTKQKLNVLYVSAEESLLQVKMRAERLGISQKNLFVLSETGLEKVMSHCEKLKPHILVIDSIQTLFSQELESAPGTVSQVRHCAARLMYLAKKNNIATFIVGHVTKEGSIAGPRVLEHMVDTVLYFDSDPTLSFRILRSIKNRFGSTHEIGVFEMQEKGLVEINNPSSFFLSERSEEKNPGSIVVSSLEGTRPILVELQALVSQTSFAAPRRTTLGLDPQRVSLLLAVLEKSSGIILAGHDVYVNVAGGIKIQETASDLGTLLVVMSSFKNVSLPHDVLAIGEVGLSGELRAVRGVDVRVGEAKKLGFKKCVLPQKNLSKLKSIKGIELVGVSNIEKALELFF
ncbi:MAG: DNA repair protein RadA [Deltaproteobacteria bacterium]|nr:DNA repair protein RadA [Deltaproteobacteria bacterium]